MPELTPERKEIIRMMLLKKMGDSRSRTFNRTTTPHYLSASPDMMHTEEDHAWIGSENSGFGEGFATGEMNESNGSLDIKRKTVVKNTKIEEQ